MKRAALGLLLLSLIAGCATVTSVPTENDYLTGNFSGCLTGAYVNGLGNLASFQSTSGKKLALVLLYVHWREPFPTAEADTIDSNGSVPVITWEPWLTAEAGTLDAIASGAEDEYITAFLTAARSWGKPFFLRFAHEMNGNWYPWDGFHNGGADGPAKYVNVWRHIYSVRESLSAGNARLVWCPNNVGVPAEAWNSPAAYFPGDGYVDWIGLDGYNWGNDCWQSFDQIFSSAYTAITALSDKPVMIGEFASATAEGDKAAWITDAFSGLKTGYPRIKAFCWFNINKERDWRIDSSAAAAAAYKNVLQDAHFLATMK